MNQYLKNALDPEKLRGSRTLILLCVALLGSFFVYNVRHVIVQPLLNDEAEFGAAAEAILKTGTPIYYVGSLPEELKPPGDRWIFQATPKPEHQFGAWHTNLLLYLMAASYDLFGVSSASSRLPGLLCLLATFFLCFQLLRHLNGEDERKIAGLATIILFVVLSTSPFLLQNGLMVDFDNTLVTVSSLWFLLEYLRYKDRPNAFSTFYLSSILLVTFWSKEYAPIFLLTPAALYQIANRSWRNLLNLLLISLLTTAAALSSWYIYCQISGVPEDYFLRFSYLRRMAAAEPFSWPSHFAKIFWSARLSSVWNGGVLYALLLGVLFWRRPNSSAQDRSGTNFLALFCLVFFFITKLIHPQYVSMKYEYPAYPVLFVLLAHKMAFHFRNFTRGQATICILLIIANAAAAFFVFHDPVLAASLYPNDWVPFGSMLLLQTIGSLIIYIVFRKLSLQKAVALATSVFAVGLGGSIATGFIQQKGYQTTANWNSDYGTIGFEDLIEFLKTQQICDSKAVLRKDIGVRLASDLGCSNYTWYLPQILPLLPLNPAPAARPPTLPFSAQVIVREIDPAVTPLYQTYFEILGYKLVRRFDLFHVFIQR